MAVIYQVKKEHALVVLSEQHKMKGIQLVEAVKTEPPAIVTRKKDEEPEESATNTGEDLA